MAIARAIVKKPYVILADEPTGNLDNVTATSIVELLKELSRDCLIVIVSHNTIDTYKYADRIIQLAGGRILSDETRNPTYAEDVSYADQVLYYPMDKTLTHEDIRVFNAKLEKQEIRQMVGRNDKYLPTTAADKKDERSIQIDRKSLSAKNIVKLCLTFLKSKLVRITASSFMIAVIMVILALSQTILLFDSGEVISKEMEKIGTSAVTLTKLIDEETKAALGENAQDFYMEITDGEIRQFVDAGYKGDIYKIYNYYLPIATSAHFAGWQTTSIMDSIYPCASLGTMVIDEAFLQEKFGEVVYLAEAEEIHPGGVWITDYLADAFYARASYYMKETQDYQNLTGSYIFSTTFLGTRGYINGVIQTGYRERYADLFDRFKEGAFESTSDLFKDPDFMRFSDEVFASLGYSYSLNPNFAEDFGRDYPSQIVWHHMMTFNGVPFFSTYAPQIREGVDGGYTLTGNEVLMNINAYNEVFGTEYTAANLNTFVPHTVDLKEYRYYDLKLENPLFEQEVTIKGLFSPAKTNVTLFASQEIFDQFAPNTLFVSGLYFNDNENVDAVIDTADELGFQQNTVLIEGIHTMTKAVDVFIPIFELVAIVLCAGIVFILISFSTKMIKDKIHEIGILKALGCKNNTIGVVFGLQLLLIAICTVLLSTVGYFFFIDLANDVLIESLKMLAPSHIVLDLDFLTFKMSIVYLNSLLVLALTLISFVIPMIKIYRIKPVQIIKAKE